MDAVEFLVAQHRDMERLLEEARTATDDQQRQTCFDKIADELAMHIAAEEKVFYPAVAAKFTEYDLLLSLEEHLSLKRLLADLLTMDASEPTFYAKLKVMTDQAVHHHKQEEDYLFLKVNSLIEPAQRQSLGKEMQALQRGLDRQGQPREAIKDELDAAATLD